MRFVAARQGHGVPCPCRVADKPRTTKSAAVCHANCKMTPPKTFSVLSARRVPTLTAQTCAVCAFAAAGTHSPSCRSTPRTRRPPRSGEDCLPCFLVSCVRDGKQGNSRKHRKQISATCSAVRWLGTPEHPEQKETAVRDKRGVARVSPVSPLQGRNRCNSMKQMVLRAARPCADGAYTHI